MLFFRIISAKIPTAKVGTKKECLANSQTPMSHFMSLMSRFMSPWSFE